MFQNAIIGPHYEMNVIFFAPQLATLNTMIIKRFQRLLYPAIFCLATVSFNSVGEEPNCEDGICTTRYDTAFFDSYAPITALDLIDNVPGFTLDNGSQSTRGFSGSAGNILIDGIRMSSKSESPRDQLGAIPVQTVEAIEVYRGNLGKFDLANQSVVANIIRKKDVSGSGTVEFALRQWQESDKIKPRAELNYTSEFKGINYNANLVWSKYENYTDRFETVTDANDQLLQIRDDLFQEDGEFMGMTLNGRTKWGNAAVNVILKYEEFDEAGGLSSNRSPVDAQDFNAFFLDIDIGDNYEIGFDIEKSFGENLSAKLIAITIDEDFTEKGGLTRTVGDDVFNDSAFALNEDIGEDIVRLELDYTGWDFGKIQFFLEGTINELKSDFALSTNVDGVLVPQDVAGATTDVKEERFDARITNSFDLYGLNFEASLGAEDSTITQTGGFEASRSFFFLKPNLTVSKTMTNNRQLRARVFRTVGQLNFGDFTSGVNLVDDQLQLGNPELRPQTVITFDVRYEQTFEGVGAYNITFFYDEIEDVVDLLPLRDNLELTGNIGKGTRYGIRGDFTIPMDFTGLENSRLDTRFSFQDSDVTDPVTGEQRILSDFEEWEYNIAFRQDLKASNLAWGLTYFADDFREFYGLDEFSAFGNEYRWSFFAEKRFGEGMKIRLDLENFNHSGEARQRIVYAGRRGDSPILFKELRDTEYARRVFLTFSKTF